MAKAIILIGPSGVGKDSIAIALRERHPEVIPSVSCTTRPPREGEVDGVAYHFLSDAQFDSFIQEKAFLEWDAFHNARYGTLVAPVKKAIHDGKSVIFVVNARGAHALRSGLAAHGLPCVAIFLMPPDVETLRQRMRNRGDSEENIQKRFAAVAEELSHKDEFDCVVVNDDFDVAFSQVEQAVGSI